MLLLVFVAGPIDGIEIHFEHILNRFSNSEEATSNELEEQCHVKSKMIVQQCRAIGRDLSEGVTCQGGNLWEGHNSQLCM